MLSRFSVPLLFCDCAAGLCSVLLLGLGIALQRRLAIWICRVPSMCHLKERDAPYWEMPVSKFLLIYVGSEPVVYCLGGPTILRFHLEPLWTGYIVQWQYRGIGWWCGGYLE